MTTSNWNTTRLGEVLVLGSGETKPADTQALPDGSRTIPVYGGNGISGFTAASFIDRTTLVIGRVGEYCGSVHLVSPPAWITDNALFVKKWNGNHSVEYFGYLLDHLNLSRLRNKGGQPLISQKPIYALEVQLPSHDEQVAIATRLATWDRGIRQLSGLIVARLRFKQGLMQQLLTGRRRFPQFKDEWKQLRVGDIAHEVSERNGHGAAVPVLSCTKHDGLVDSLKYFGKQVFSDDTSNYKIVRRQDFAYATNHIEEGSIGLLTESDAGLVSPMYTVFRTNDEVLPEFLYRLFKTETYRQIFASFTSASVNRRGSLRWRQFATIPLSLPNLAEQKRIDDALASLDKEIALLRKQQDALKQQKKGLMQKLLTGQVRVKVR